ncbi:putative ATP-dependent endonuclease of OLD family [Arthrobacter bambusae]|uniref:ATP-dependent endonuclease of OLD family n=1 Tax=Arthrobacter bambusae TaxID=1338426 RepID=A0ABV2P3Y4_9MICC
MKISGFRGHGQGIEIPINAETTTLIGRNDAGKSSVFEALEVFFGGSKLELTDFSVGLDVPVDITCTFSALPSSIVVDENRATTLADEYLLDMSNALTLVKRWSRSKLTSPTIFASAIHPVFQDQTDLLNMKLPELKKIAKQRGILDNEVDDKRTSSSYRQAIWRDALKVGDAEMKETFVPLTSEDGKSVASALMSYLPQFHLFKADRPGTEADQLAQDPAKAAIKAVLDDHEEQLEILSATVQHQVGEILADVVLRLSEVAPELASSLSTTDLAPTWSKAFSGLQFVDENGVPLSKRGSGTRRLVLLSFFRATAERGLDADDLVDAYRRGVITAVEEPETALHADLQTDIVSALQDVGELPHRQVLLTTHSANLIRLVPANSIRYIKGSDLERECIRVSDDGDATGLLGELNRSLGVFTDHNVRCFLLVEGRNDVVGLKNLSEALAAAGIEGVASLAQMEAEGLVCFMPIGGGGSASLWQSNLSPFKRPEVHIMDSDRESEGHALKVEMKTLLERADEKRHVFVLDRRELENYLTPDAVLESYSDIEGFAAAFNSLSSVRGDWDYLDIPSICAEAVHSLAGSEDAVWDSLSQELQKRKESKAKKRLSKAFSHSSVAESFSKQETDALRALKMITELAVESN